MTRLKAKPKRPRPPTVADIITRLYTVHSHILDQLVRLEAQGVLLMPVLADIQAKIATLTAAVAANTQVDGSIVTLLQGLTAMIASLKEQLAAAIATGSDPAALQAVLDGLSAAETSIAANTQKLADAAVANTPA